VPVRVERDLGGAFDVELEDCLQVTVEVGKSDLLRIDSVHSKLLRDCCLALAPLYLYLSLGALCCLETIEDVARLFDLDLAGELIYEFAEGAETLAFLPNKLDESTSLGDQTCTKYSQFFISLRLDLLFPSLADKGRICYHTYCSRSTLRVCPVCRPICGCVSRGMSSCFRGWPQVARSSVCSSSGRA